MGLDSVELIMTVEEAFGIEISDEEAQTICTVGDFHACVMSKLGKIEARDHCLTQHAFYRLRQGLEGETQTISDRIRPTTRCRASRPVLSRADR